MMQGFYMLALQRARRQKAHRPGGLYPRWPAFCRARLFCPSAVAANAPLEPYVAYDAGGTLAVSAAAKRSLYGDRHRSLPQATVRRSGPASSCRMPKRSPSCWRTTARKKADAYAPAFPIFFSPTDPRPTVQKSTTSSSCGGCA